MRAQNVELVGLLRGFVRRDESGVVVLATLQQQGYVYLRP
jgi:intracellular sulfur oxidation DsrE/DsrF family protein